MIPPSNYIWKTRNQRRTTPNTEDSNSVSSELEYEVDYSKNEESEEDSVQQRRSKGTRRTKG